MLVEKLGFYKPLCEVFGLYCQNKGAAFLDSSLHNALGRYSIIGLNPYLVLEERDGRCYSNGMEQEQTFEQLLRKYLAGNREENPTELPLIAGAIGYFSYDYGRKFEAIKTIHKKDREIPDAWFCFYDNYLIEDVGKRILYISAKGILEEPGASIAGIKRQIKGKLCYKRESPPKHNMAAEFTADFPKEFYQDAIAQMIRYIIEGDIYIANMTQRLSIPSKKGPYEVFTYLRKHNPAPFGAYLNGGDFQVISASMERFLKLRNGWVETRPIKGTRRRGVNAEEDMQLKEELRNSEKDKSELLMIVDLLRNYLSKVCRTGSVQVTELFAVETYATVFHLVSTIIGQIEEGCGVIELIEATFPGGSITGAPKIRAMEIIDELERGCRGIYTGSIGYLSLDGSCDLNIAIRTAIYQNGIYQLGIGGGITCESETEFEYEETLQKAKAILEAAYDGIY